MMFTAPSATPHHRTPPTPSSVTVVSSTTSSSSSSSSSASGKPKNAEVRKHKTSLAQSMKDKFAQFFGSVTNGSDIEDILSKPREAKPGAEIVNLSIGEPIIDLRSHVNKLYKALPPHMQSNDCTNGFDLEFDSLSKFDFQIRRTSGVFATAQRSCNLSKNRFKNILANENTRVKLQVPHMAQGEEGEELSDYINANFIEAKYFHLTPPDYCFNNNLQQPQQFQQQQFQQQPSFQMASLSSSVLSTSAGNGMNNNTNATTLTFTPPPYPVPEGFRFGNVRYIAAQAPMLHCVGEFFQMLWEQDVGSIIALANEIQDNHGGDDEEPPTPSNGNNMNHSASFSLKKKSSFFDSVSSNKVQKYWPSNHVSQTFGDLTVTTVSEEFHSTLDIYVRKIEMKRGQQQNLQQPFQPQPNKKQQDAFFDDDDEADVPAAPCETKTITMYHYVGWPDMGVPKHDTSIRYLLKKLDKFVNVPNPRPILVHCNAGVGRTGTFLNVHLTYLQMKEYLAAKKLNQQLPPFKFNIYETSRILKQMRLGMIQKKEQYMFCYTTILAEAADLKVLSAQPPAELIML